MLWVCCRYGTPDHLRDEAHANIPAIFNALQVSAGYLVDCALIDGGTIQCWGNNLNHQLGDGSGAGTLASTINPRASKRNYQCRRPQNQGVFGLRPVGDG